MESNTRPALLDGVSETERSALFSDAGLARLQAVFAVVPDPVPGVGGATTSPSC